MTSKKVWVLFLHLFFTFPRKLRTSPGVLAHLDNQNMDLLQMLDFTVHDLDRFFNEVEFVVDLDFIQRYGKSLVRHAFLQVRDVKSTVNSAQLFREFKSIGNGSYFSNDLESLDKAFDLNNLLGCRVDDLWASELTISNFSLADR
ncbi:hypothetical protein Tco_0847100 [Tanacetum coccineum]